MYPVKREGMARLRRDATLDAGYAVTFATAGALLLAWISARMPSSTSPLQWVALLPILAGRCWTCSRTRG
jgi:hypothetical protein